MLSRSLALSVPPLTGFSLEPAAVQLPNASHHQRTHSLAWPQQAQSTVEQLPVTRPSFFESQRTVAAAPLYQVAPTQLSAQPQPVVNPVLLPELPQHPPSYAPTTGSRGYIFNPQFERDDKYVVHALQHYACRPELQHKSVEELRMEDYANATAAVQPPTLFGTSTTGVVPAATSLFAAPVQPTGFSSFTPNLFAQPQIPAWGTATAGFGGFGGFGGAAVQPQPQPQPQQPPQPLITSFFTRPQQPTIFAPQANAFATAFQQQPSIFGTSTFQQPQPAFGAGFAPSSIFGQPAQTNLTSPLFGLQTAYGSAFGVLPKPAVPQVPMQAHFCWNLSAIDRFRLWQATLPASISSVSFGGVTVPLPTLEEVAAWKLAEKSRLSKIDDDPYGVKELLVAQRGQERKQQEIENSQPIPAVERPRLQASSSEGSTTVEPSSLSPVALARGTSSPVLTGSSRNSPLISPSSHHRRSDTLTLPGITASLSHSPRLQPLPASPYLTGRHLTDSPQHRALGTPSAGPSPSRRASGRQQFQLSSHASPAAGTKSPPVRVLFASQAEARHVASPNRPCATPSEHRTEALDRELAWAQRLVE